MSLRSLASAAFGPTALFVLLWSSGALFAKWGLAYASAFVFDVVAGTPATLVDERTLGAARERAYAQLGEGRDKDDGFYPDDA